MLWDNLHLLVFDYFYVFSCIYVIAFLLYIYSLYVTPFSYHHSLPWPSLTTETIPANFRFLFSPDMHHKTSTERSFVLLFRLFFVPPISLLHNARIRTHAHPPTPIYTQMPSGLKSMMLGELSPAIEPELGTARPFLPLYALLLCPPMPPTHQRTHTSPSAPIHIYFTPCAP